jgi:hypothetical protein
MTNGGHHTVEELTWLSLSHRFYIQGEIKIKLGFFN